MSDETRNLRARTRRAIHADIAQTAERLFLEQGYEVTTMEEVAAAAGISPRSVYRYFPAKDDLLVGRFGAAANLVVEELKSRPDTEAVWQSLHAGFAPMIAHADLQDDREAARRIHRTIFTTPSLVGRYLYQLQVSQLAAGEVLRARPAVLQAVGAASDGDVLLTATIGAAFSGLLVAQRLWSIREDSESVASLLSQAMAATEPANVLHRSGRQTSS
jgi:AcrR family transcriptional regulator